MATARQMAYLTRREVASRLGVSQVRISQLMKSGALRPAIRLERSPGFDIEEVESLRRARDRVHGRRSAA